MKLEDLRFRLGRGGEWSDVLTFADIWGYEGEDCGIFTHHIAGVDKLSGQSGCTHDGIYPGWEIKIVEPGEL
ncbi:MAG: hypothetical protein IJI35_00570 [Kiritimatiellae bacterium]|nr:hypothetical protein [Kiritimatiellia bacterium]